MKVLITGCSGFIGSNLLERCLAEGWDVFGVDNMSNGHRKFMPRVICNVDFDDFVSRRSLREIRNNSWDVVFHLAAVPRVSYSVEHPVETNNTNVSKTIDLLTACRDCVGRVVFASSSSVYGGADVLPTPETCPKNPQSPYALQKSIVEEYLKLYSSLYKLDSACLRFFNVFGKNALGSSPYATALSAWLTAIKSGQPMRSDGDGTQSRDLCHVDNVVEACVLAAKHSGSLQASCYNVACGDRTMNNEIMKYLQSRYPLSVKLDAPWRPGDVMHTQADISKISSTLGYAPLVRVWEGIEKTCDWYDANWSWIQHLKQNI